MVKNYNHSLPGLMLIYLPHTSVLLTFSAKKRRYMACCLHLTLPKPLDMTTFQPECSRRLYWSLPHCLTSQSDLVNYWMNGKSHLSHLFQNQTSIQIVQATAQYHSCPFWANSLTDIRNWGILLTHFELRAPSNFFTAVGVYLWKVSH